MNYPKEPRQRNPYLLKMAQGEPCLLRVPGVCNGDSDTTVAAHSNQSAHGKGKAMKAHDWASVWACSACRCWLDVSVATRAEKELTFSLGLNRQIKAWEDIAGDEKQPERDRRAAAWALERIAT
jgi:hypothetical protein